MNKLTRYQTVLYLLLTVAVLQAIWGSIIVVQQSNLTTPAITISVVAFLILFGVWVQSVIVSFVGLMWMLVWVGALIWPVVSSPQPFKMLFVILVILAALNLVTAGIMLTKKFRTEFAYERRHQPKYKLYLKQVVFGAVLVCVVIATINDVVHLLRA